MSVQDHTETIKECHKPPYFRKRYSEIRKVPSSVYIRAACTLFLDPFSLIPSPCPVCAHEYWVPLVSYYLRIHCKFSVDFDVQVFGFLRELLETLSECSTCLSPGITKKGPPASLNCPTRLPAMGPNMDGYAACQCEGSLKARFVATKPTYLDNLRKNQLCFFRSLWYLCALANWQSTQVSDRMDRPAQVHTHSRPDSFMSVQIHTDQPGLLTDTLWEPLCFVLPFRAPGDGYWGNSQNNDCFYWQRDLLCGKKGKLLRFLLAFIVLNNCKALIGRTPCAFYCCKTTDKNIKNQSPVTGRTWPPKSIISAKQEW